MVVELVFTVEMQGLRIMGGELVKTVHQRVLRSEQAEHPFRFHYGKPGVGNGPVLLHKGFRDHEGSLPVLAGRVKVLLPQTVVFQDGIGQVHRRIHANAVETGQLFRIHATHGSTHDQIRILPGADVLQQPDRLMRIHGQVRRDHRRLRQQQPHPPHRPAGAGRGKTVDIEDLLAGEKCRPRIFIQFHTAKVRIIPRN